MVSASPALWKDLERTGAKIRITSNWFNAASVEATGAQLNQIAQIPSVLKIDEVRGVTVPPPPKPRGLPMDARFASVPSPGTAYDYGMSYDQLNQIGVPELHSQGLDAKRLTGEGVTIAVLDSGFHLSHEAFRHLRIQTQWDFVSKRGSVEQTSSNSADSYDDHGTMTLSVLAGFAPGKLIGPAFNATFILARTEDEQSETRQEEDYWIAGLEWAESLGADIVLSSLGYRDFDDPKDNHPFSSLDGNTLMISKAARMAQDRGVLIVNSIGNMGWDGEKMEPREGSLVAPADVATVLSVGGVNRKGELFTSSSRGPTADGRIKPDVVARGVQTVLATKKGYGSESGTSFAAALVAGVAALVLQAHPTWTPQQLHEALTQTASQANTPDNDFGYGIVDAGRALRYQPVQILAFRPPLRTDRDFLNRN